MPHSALKSSATAAFLFAGTLLCVSWWSQPKTATDVSLFSVLDACVESMNASRDPALNITHPYFNVTLRQQPSILNTYDIQIEPKESSPYKTPWALQATLVRDQDHILRIVHHILKRKL